MESIPTPIDSPTYKLILLLRSHFLTLTLTLLLLRFLSRRYLSPLRSYPGPFLASGSRAWKVWSTYRGHTELDHIALHARYGPIVRIAPNEVSLSSQQAAKDVFTVGKGFHKTDFYAVFPPPENPDIFTEVREWKHAQMKRFAATPYSLASMQKMTPSIEEVERVLVDMLKGYAGRGETCDLGNWLHWFAFDVLGEVAFSRRFGFLAEGKDVGGQIKAIDDVQWYDGIVGQLPWVDMWLRQNPLKKYLAPVLPFLDLKPTPMKVIALDEMGRRERGDKGVTTNEDLLDQLLKAHRGKPDKFSKEDVFAIAHGAIFAGSDSTASTMQSFFYRVLNDERVYEKLTSEIREAELSPMVSYQEAQNLPFFQACLKEAMRVRPAVGLNITRHVPKGGAEIDGTFFPGGTRVALNGWVLHLDKGTFGEDSDVYRPERWVEAGEGKAREMERGMYQVSDMIRASFDDVANGVIVWGWESSVHWEEPRAVGDEQGLAAVAEGVRLRVGT
jgi:cytochrome P450